MTLAACSSKLVVDSEDSKGKHSDKAEMGDPNLRDGGLVDRPSAVEPDDNLIPSEPDGEQPACGNSILDEEESCDDGNTEADDGCSEDCLLEDGYTCPVVGKACELATICGDSRQTGGEGCDDGNTEDGDGCSATCLLEANFACPTPGEDCVSTVACGDSRISGGETCDDGNTDSDDGCDKHCQVEEGWTCSTAGLRCTAICGDSLIIGRETCDDGNMDDGDGCSSTCHPESGYACDTPGDACTETVCGDGVVEGDEPCDDGDDIHVGDGCSPGCKLEPVCAPAVINESSASGDAGAGSVDVTPGVCSSTCGDGLILAGDAEECDDGNNVAGDGCDEECRIEDGWECKLASDTLPDELVLPVVYRDFIHKVAPDGTLPRHPDFEVYSGGAATPGLVGPILGANGKPVYTGLCEAGTNFTAQDCPYDEQTTSKADFDQWYVDTDGVNIAVPGTLTFNRQPDDTYVFDGGGGLFPVDNAGWVATDPPEEATSNNHNFGFTTELRYWFEFKGGEFLEFEGDDDVWVFIGGQLVVDIGGLHPSTTGSVTLDDQRAAALGLEVGRVYEMALFHAERHTAQSNFKLTIGGFLSTDTICNAVCGDGVVAGDELCDDGEDNGKGYGFCTDECLPGPRCGDGVLDDEEDCDNGVNLSGYQSASEEDACAPGCVLPPSCGDGELDSGFGEQCDEGKDNTGEYDGCNEDCTLGPRCGDGIVNGDELCDDGNVSNADSCDITCMPITVTPK